MELHARVGQIADERNRQKGEPRRLATDAVPRSQAARVFGRPAILTWSIEVQQHDGDPQEKAGWAGCACERPERPRIPPTTPARRVDGTKAEGEQQTLSVDRRQENA